MMSQDLSKLNREAIEVAKKYMGEVCWPTVALTSTVVALYIANLVLFVNGVIPVWLATFLFACLTFMSYSCMHESAHVNISGDNEQLRWLNNLCGFLAAPLISVPYTSQRYEHLVHHRYTNQPDKDPDFISRGIRKGFLYSNVTVLHFIWAQITYFGKHRWHNSSLKERVIYCSEIAFIIGWKVAFIALVNQPGAAVVILFGFYAGGYFTVYWFAYRPHIPFDETKRYKNTTNMLMPNWMKPLEWFWLGQNLHATHHLFPRVPLFKYHALTKEIEPILRAHGTPIIGVYDRQPK